MEASFEYPVGAVLLNLEASFHFGNTLSELLSEGHKKQRASAHPVREASPSPLKLGKR
jgi:hypothetical protein